MTRTSPTQSRLALAAALVPGLAAADKTITVTNSRTAPTPTGLLLDAAPYGTMLLAAGTGSVLLLRKRRNSDE